MGFREKWAQFRQEWADTPVPERKPKPLKQNGTCSQFGCDEPAWGNNDVCDAHIVCLGGS